MKITRRAMRFKDRTQAGQLLAEKLEKYKDKDAFVYALPRGGVVTAVEVAKYLNAPLDLIITRKIGHPYSPEYAIAATAENGHIVGTRAELMIVENDWLEEEIKKQRLEAARRRKRYLHGRETTSPEGKIVILVDDGVATGLTLRVGIIELRHHNPSKIIVAVPVVPRSTAKVLRTEADELVALEIPSEETFLGAIGAYYDSFMQVEDQEVIKILDAHSAWLQKEKALGVFSVKDGRRGDNLVHYDKL